jgi:hypothetical protein
LSWWGENRLPLGNGCKILVLLDNRCVDDIDVLIAIEIEIGRDGGPSPVMTRPLRDP